VKLRTVRLNRFVIGLAVLALVGSACQAQTTLTPTRTVETSSATSSTLDSAAAEPAESEADPAEAAAPAEPEPETSTDEPAPAEPAAPQVVDLLALQMHPGGTQAQVRQMTFGPDETTAIVQLVNGREFNTPMFVSRTQTALIDAGGREYPAEGLDDFELAEATVMELPLRFGAVDPGAGPFTLRLNYHADDKGVDENNPGFEIQGIDVSAAVPSLPASFGIADTANHEFGMQVRVFGLAFTETSIGLSVEVINNGPQGATYNRSRYESFLEDDLGNRYQLEMTPNDYYLEIEDGDRMPGVFVYAGRIDPRATSLRGVLNNTGEPDGRTLSPRLEFGPYNLDGSTPPAGGALNPITQVQQYTHPNGADFVMNSITFSETGTVVNVVTENDERTVPIRLALAGKTFLVDDLGNQYAILPPPDNTGLEIPGGTGLDADLSFPGAISLDASTIEVVLNNGQSAEASDIARNSFPEVHFGPFPLTRAAPVVGVPPADVPALTTMGVELLEGSETAPLTLIFDEFDGRLVSGGVLLTLPQDILFDSGSASLRGSSRDAISKIVQITEFYAGDPMTVIGHTDSDGDDAYNQDLSEQRASSVVDALVAAGANAGLITAEGRGESEPIASNDDDAGKQANRRVEVFFATDKGLPE